MLIFFFKIIAINIFKVNNFHLLIEISLAKYVILRKQVFNQIFWETIMESMLNIHKRMDQNDLGMVNNTIQSYIWKVSNCSLGELDLAEKRIILDWSFKCTLLTWYNRIVYMYTIHKELFIYTTLNICKQKHVFLLVRDSSVV